MGRGAPSGCGRFGTTSIFVSAVIHWAGTASDPATRARSRRRMSEEPSILFVNQHYWPDVASTGQHLTDLAEHLACRGFDVSVLTGRADYMGGELEVPAREERNGVRIRRVDVPGFGRGHLLGRTADYAAFHVKAAVAAALEPRPDLVISLTTPSLLPATVRAVCAARGVPYAVWAMDLHPDIEDRLDLLPDVAPFVEGLHAASEWGYRAAEFVVSLGPYMEERIVGKGVPTGRVRRIPVWSRRDEIRPVPREENPLREAVGLDGAFTVMYSGNAGYAHRFDEVLHAMRLLDGEDGVEFLFVGGGPREEEIRGYVDEHGISSFRWRDYFPRKELDRSLSIGDVHLVTLRPDMAGLAAPGKLQGILAAGRPAVMVGPEASDPGRVLAETGVGAVVEPDGDPREGGERLAAVLLELRDQPDRRRELGRRAREVFLERFEREPCCRDWEELLRQRVA